MQMKCIKKIGLHLFSVVSYIALMVGAAMSALLIPLGFVILIIGILSALLMYWIIDPKLRSISAEYEKRKRITYYN